jgi:hypothetical protein
VIAREPLSARSDVFGTRHGGQSASAQEAHRSPRCHALTSSRRWPLSLAGPRHGSGAGGPGSLVRAARGRSNVELAYTAASVALADELHITYLRSAPWAPAGTSRPVPAPATQTTLSAREAGAKEEN